MFDIRMQVCIQKSCTGINHLRGRDQTVEEIQKQADGAVHRVMTEG